MDTTPTEQKFFCVKSYVFALHVVKLSQWLTTEKREFVLSKQILRSGTSIGANIEEAYGTHTHKDFAAKFQISLKEARETRYWLRLLSDSGYLAEQEAFTSVFAECDELIRLLVSALKTARENDQT